MRLVNVFYDRVRKDELLAPVFSAVDWETHLPIMYNFWGSILLGEQSYHDSPLSKHMPLKISTAHFNRWLELFVGTVDELFYGFVATEAKTRAETIARLFQYKMGLMG
jgi:hemoglobin